MTTIRRAATALLCLSTLLIAAASCGPGGRSRSGKAASPKPGAIHVTVGAKGKGSAENPAGSLAEALAICKKSGKAEIRLAEGSWDESVVIDIPVKVTGGYDPGFSSIVGRSSIRGVAAAEGTLPAEGYGASATVAARARPEAAIAIRGEGGRAELANLDVTGPQTLVSAAISVSDGASLELSDSSAAGNGSQWSAGIDLAYASARILRTRVSAGPASGESAGIICESSSLGLWSSAIDGGGSFKCQGLKVSSSPDVKIISSTIWGGSGKNAAGIYINYSSPSILGCIIGAAASGESWGIYEDLGDSNPDVLENNAFIGCSSGIYFDDAETAFSAVDASGNPAAGERSLSSPPGRGNLIWKGGSLGPGLSTPPSAPASIRQGTPASVAEAATDIDGKPRTEPWSLGAWEIDQ